MERVIVKKSRVKIGRNSQNVTTYIQIFTIYSQTFCKEFLASFLIGLSGDPHVFDWSRSW